VSSAEASTSPVQDQVLRAAATILGQEPFVTVTLERVSATARVSQEEVTARFASMHHLGSAILDHERASMRHIQERVADDDDPLEQIVHAFRLVGENLAKDIVVRAGVRIAQESRREFPERRLDPFRTWESFVDSQLRDAVRREMVRGDIDIGKAVRLIVVAGMGTKELIAVRGNWTDAPELLGNTATDMLSLIVSLA